MKFREQRGQEQRGQVMCLAQYRERVRIGEDEENNQIYQ